MQVMLGTPASKRPLDEFIPRVGVDAVEIVAEDGTALAYLVPATQSGDDTYARFEKVFQSHAEELRRRAAMPRDGITTQELLAKLHAMTDEVESPCDSR
jgi:hypothetical protein